MNSKEIRELIELISSSNLESFELEREGLRLKVVRQPAAGGPAHPAPPPSDRVVAAPPAVETAPAGGGDAAPAPVVDSGLVDIPSPIVGTFYSAPSPDAEPFVKVGSRIAPGQTLCIVEAMKVMNEIESEHSGEIVEVLVTNGQPIEFGEVMFRLRPA